MKFVRLILCSAAIAVVPAAPAAAQSMNMPGMTMPMPAKPAAKKKAPIKKAAQKKAARKAKAPAKPAVGKPTSKAVEAKPMPMPMVEGRMNVPMPGSGSKGSPPMDHQPRGHLPMDQSSGSSAMGAMKGMDHGATGHDMPMTGVLGSYPVERESSGTAWQPDSSEHMGVMAMSAGWTLMAHGALNFTYDHQSGPRGDAKAFASGMLMGMARRPIGNGTLQLRTSISPDPLMGARGYPLLLASGETADGVKRLVDRQHPHDFFMELSGSVSQNFSRQSSAFLYAGLPGEPAFGPPAFMHREAIMDSHEAPISHHWLDSTHISFGVVTAGLVVGPTKVEVSRFNAREPDQHRWNIETGPLDATSVRLSWNPTRELALQGSWGRFKDPEQLEPGVDQTRWSASLLYANDVTPGWKLAGTLAWGRKQQEGHKDDAYVAEASLKHGGWTMFGRGERTENRELLAVESPAYRVGKVSLGAVRDFRLTENVSLGAGGLFAVNFVPKAIAPLYGGHNPTGAMAFARLKLN